MSSATHKPNTVAMQYFALILALVFVGQFSGFFTSFSGVGAHVVNQMASVTGMSVGVPPNEMNLLAQDLEKRAGELTEREKAIDAKERDVRAIVAEENAKHDKFMLSVILGVTLILTTLIVFNFYFDRRRNARGENVAGVERSPQELPPKTGSHAHEGEFTTKL